MKKLHGQIIDIYTRRIFPGVVVIENGRIRSMEEMEHAPNRYIMPGFIDAHIHIESSMVVPYEFARIALGHGTVATVSDPHEIANVLGMGGVRYMIDNARDAALKFHFGAPSCVPATSFETSGASLDSDDVRKLLESEDIYYLSEMMNYPGVLNNDDEVMKKIRHALDFEKVIDGHAPGLKGKDAERYAAAGITTDHECFTVEEALDKIQYGMKIIIREGSAAKNFNALHPLISEYSDNLMFCSDDKHPDDLLEGHINLLVIRALKLGYDLFDVLKIACSNPVEHYGLRSGRMQVGDPADLIVVKDLERFEVLKTYIDGHCVYADGSCSLTNKRHPVANAFNIGRKVRTDFAIRERRASWPIIRAINGELITEKEEGSLPEKNGFTYCDPLRDILKIAVVNRYHEAQVSTGFITGFGIKNGAIASTVAHDSHNIIAVGTTDEDICLAVNLLVQSQGGLSAVCGTDEKQIALPIAGLMSDKSCKEIGDEYQKIDAFVKEMGSKLSAPFMSLSFMALLVIPKIKISDKGMFDAEAFRFYD